MEEKKIFIFDLDGTLVDAYKAIEESLNIALKKMKHIPVSLECVKRSVGEGDKLFIERFFPPNEREEALKLYRRHHKESLKKFVKLLPYAKMLLYNLKRKKKTAAIASNRPLLFTMIILKKLQIQKYIDFVLCADEINKLKPDPAILYFILKKFSLSREEAVYAGDMDIDLETAKRAGIDAVFVLGGSTKLEDVQKYKNKKVVSSLREILKLYN